MSQARPGLVSVTFRGLTVPEVADLARRAGLESVEWGGDVHVPHGDLAAARAAAVCTRDAGLAVAAYGSYYRLGGPGGGGRSLPSTAPRRFEDVLGTALALGAPLVRVWAGGLGSAHMAPAARERVTADARRAAALAQAAGLRLGLEFHAGTLTDTPESALRLLREVDHPALTSFWQPPVGLSREACEAGLRSLVEAGRLSSVHVFHWWPDAATRLPLARGAGRWRGYLDLARSGPGGRDCCLEFVRGDDPGQLLEDAATLRRWLASAPD